MIRVGDRSFAPDRPVLVNDFIAHYAGAQFAARGALEQAYVPERAQSLQREIAGNAELPLFPVAYPPFFYLAIMPMAHLEMVWAFRLWLAITFSALLVVALRIDPHWHTLLLVPLFPAVAFSAAAGQNGILSAVLIGAGLLLLRNRPVASGIAFGLMAYKPQLAVAIPFFLLAGGHYRSLAATAATALATVLLSVLAFGPEPLAAFFSSAAAQGSKNISAGLDPIIQRMPTVLVSMLRLTANNALAWSVYGLVALGALAALVHVWRSTQQPGLRALALASAMPLVSPYVFDYDLAVLVIPFIYLAREMRLCGMNWGRLLLLAALWATPPAVTLLLSDVGVPIAPLVWICLLAYAARACPREPARTVAA